MNELHEHNNEHEPPAIYGLVTRGEDHPAWQPTYFCDGHFAYVTGTPALQAATMYEAGIHEQYCDDCSYRYRQCYDCDQIVHLVNIETIDGTSVPVCPDCYDARRPECYGCGHRIDEHEVAHTLYDGSGDAEHYCSECAPENCYTCGTELWSHEVAHRDRDGDPYCSDCNPVEQCWNCGREIDADDIAYRDSDGDPFCYDCSDAEGDGGCDCSSCREARADSGANYRAMDADIVNGVSAAGRTSGTFGIEIECNGYLPWSLGGYASDTPAPAEFFGGWRGEDDCTVEGGEFVSPPLSGAEGLAEIIATFDILESHGAHMNRDGSGEPGQHITVSYDGSGVDVQRITYVLEEAMFALTGDYKRMFGYNRRLKLEGGVLAAGNQIHIRERTVQIRDSYLAEFRYPPGTLSATQVALNLGLIRFAAELAATMPESEITEWFDESRRIQVDAELTQAEKIHEQVQLGMMLLAEYGWVAGGEMPGLPYDPNDDPPTVALNDSANMNTATVTLPTGIMIKQLMIGNLTNFYAIMGDVTGADWKTVGDWASGVAEIVHPAERVAA